jgi:hypothetical protein
VARHDAIDLGDLPAGADRPTFVVPRSGAVGILHPPRTSF